jgi:hypothetical protein
VTDVDALRDRLRVAREGLRAAEDALASVLVAVFASLVAGATPAERGALADFYAVTCEGRGDPACAKKLREAWAACGEAHVLLVYAEGDLQRALPTSIDIVLTPRPRN